MGGGLRMNRAKLRIAVVMAVFLVCVENLSFCWSLNSEGAALLRFREGVSRDPYGALSNWKDDVGAVDPCSWFGVECSDGQVVVLNLKDLGLEGMLTPELGKLTHVKSIILRNNSFWGKIPGEIAKLKELEVLDLGYNNFSGSFPSELANDLSLTTLLLDNNEFMVCTSPEIDELKTISESQMHGRQESNLAIGADSNGMSINWNGVHPQTATYRRQILATEAPTPSQNSGDKPNKKSSEASPSAAPTPSSHGRESSSPSPSPNSHSRAPSRGPFLSPESLFAPSPSPLKPIHSSPSESPRSISLTPSPSPIITPVHAPTSPEHPVVAPPKNWITAPPPVSTSGQNLNTRSNRKHQMVIISAAVVAGSVVILISAAAIFFFQRHKVVTVKPWATGLSGQLQKAFVTGSNFGFHNLRHRKNEGELPPSFTVWHIYRTNFIFQSFHSGVPKLQRSELEAACEDFSNIIGTLSDGTVYKGTLSSGVEIAVTSSAAASPDDWSKNLESQFRKKIDTLSKVNHKNFVNLIGFCEEEKPFTRMLVFEYAPNGTVFEHLHIKEAEHLDWGMRLRIIMGISYCLEYMHELTPPIAHGNLQSSSVYLTEDYAAKLSDFSFCNDSVATKIGSAAVEFLETRTVNPESNVYSLGVILFEIITGRIPYPMENGFLADWTSKCLRGEMPTKDMVDPTLKSFQEDVLQKLLAVMRECLNPNSHQRPRMREVMTKLKEITTMEADVVSPKLSPLWWAELEIMSTASSEEVKSEPRG
ncbi:probable inactive receptor-like protein kinase At3g56050 isoform X1 [Syzygium oleosum]|uniref:probable inactive receptor-like protein kinase At3g56050 isoform X1 n=1 Tax=Syzygium oleosum TaxID=219896 RepID=UPI0011D17D95|nr:probable inactive receptor-like protein kinase At3g56050 isoform X1 [Syzygium oleosum]XP_056165936.1 probable inactive receptor-like protein kinase At3g56050 isoform X1 [Syzygium oleosum]